MKRDIRRVNGYYGPECAAWRAELSLFGVSDARALELVRRLVRARNVGWHIAASGFFKMSLNEVGPCWSHVHVWDRSVAESEHLPHTHPFNFRSRIVKGTLRNFTYEVHPARYGDRTHLETEVDADLRTLIMTPVALSTKSIQTLTAGDWYKQPAANVHIAAPDDGTVTLVHKGRLFTYGRAYVPSSLDAERDLKAFLGWRELEPDEFDRLRELVG